MDQLLQQNTSCADCQAMEVSNINSKYGVFLCSSCAQAHRHLGLPIKSVQDNFSQEDLELLMQLGNEVVNSKLLRNIPPWSARPFEFPYLQIIFSAVRVLHTDNKYIKKNYCKDDVIRYPRHDLDCYWFYIDEYSDEWTKQKGPVSRLQLKELIAEGEEMNVNCFVWHPSVTNKWTIVEKLYHIINPRPTVTDDAIHDACAMKFRLLNCKVPHLKGYLDQVIRGKPVKKWVVLMGRSLMIYTKNLSNIPETTIQIEDMTDLTLSPTPPPLSIMFRYNDQEAIFTANNTREILEWLESISCTQYLIRYLGEDLVIPQEDPSEQHICNVIYSPDYMGNKLYDGFMKKEGSFIKSVKLRWFILRDTGLYYYQNKDDKAFRGKIRLYNDTLVDRETEYRYPFHFCIINRDRRLHMWAENAAQKEEWVEAIEQVINSNIYSLPQYECV